MAHERNPNEKNFYDAVADYNRTGYNSLEQLDDPTRQRAIEFILTSFQTLNAISVRAIKAALESRRKKLEEKMAKLAPEEEEEQDGFIRRRAGRRREEWWRRWSSTLGSCSREWGSSLRI